jgi:ParB family chromosome partitioning protein
MKDDCAHSILENSQVEEIDIGLVDYSKCLIREIDGQTINDLKLSIKRYGILQPILVRKKDDGHYEIICGNHRFCAAKGVGLRKIPVIVKVATDYDSLLFALQENIQRLSMDPVREGEIYSKLLPEKFSVNDVNRLAEDIGKSVAYIKGRVDVFRKLHPQLKGEIGKRLTLRHAFALCKLAPNQQIHVFEKIEQQRKTEENRYLHGQGFGGWSVPSESDRCVCSKCGAKHWRSVDTCRFQMTC